MIKRKQRVPMRDLSRLSGEDAETAAKQRVGELLILRIGWLNQAEYEWAQHVEIAKRAGLSEAEIEAVKTGPRGVWAADDAALLQAADDLYENSIVSDSTWDQLTKKYSTER